VPPSHHTPWRIRVLVAVLCAHSLLLSRAVAEDVAADANSAYEAALDRALAAHGSGDFETAEQAMRQAHALSPNARTLRGLGVILYAQGRYLEAVEPLESACTDAVKRLSPELLASTEELLARVWQRIGRLTLQIEPAESQLSIDGAPPLAHGEREVLLAAGDHHVRITAPGREPYRLALRTQPGSHDSLHVALAPRLALQPEPALSMAQAPGTADTRHVDRRWSPLVRNSLFAASAAVVAVGVATYLVGYLRFVDLKQKCEKDCGDEAERTRRFEDERIAPLTTTGVALMATGAGALLAVTGVELWQRRAARGHEGSAHTRLYLTPSGGRLQHQF
jgi:tetratricopeptide (TPR) repeat protein